ncbi:MAG: aldehyde dehydrogenase family protein [Phycisphaerales bacterium]|nr:aldehyde dehydrogenase family protein [Phycisphaerales bacterium]
MDYPVLPAIVAGRPRVTGQILEVRDKHRGTVAFRVSRAGPAEVEAAIAAACDARDAAARTPPHARSAALRSVGESLALHAEELARVVTAESGKPIRDSRAEVSRAAGTFRIAAEEATRMLGELIPLGHSDRSAGVEAISRRVPVGACSFITPFNFPLNLVAHKAAPAIAAGCPFIVKPSEKTPVSALRLGELMAEALRAHGLPEEWFSILPADIADAAPLVEDDRLALLSFTGSDTVGWGLKARAGRKRLALELGGDAACIVDEGLTGEQTARAVERISAGAFGQSGQSCISVQRVLIHASAYEAVSHALVEAARRLPVGDPADERTVVGPMISEDAAARVEGWIRQAVGAGARLLCGGVRRGAILQPTLLDRVPRDPPCAIATNEVFAPVAMLEPFDGFDAACTRVNDSRFGLQAGLFSNNLRHVRRAWEVLQVGAVVVNDVPTFRPDAMPYGGVKDSGLGREGPRSAMREFTDERLLVWGP